MDIILIKSILSVLKIFYSLFIVVFNFLKIPIIIFLVLKLYKNQLRGRFGEKSLYILLRKNLNKDDYKIINNVYIKTKSGSAQIDHIIVSRKGIFVIETKTYRGSIYGSKFAKTWTQYIKGNKYPFKNPLHQNYGHIKVLESLNPAFKHIDFQSIIAFSGECILKVSVPNAMHFSKVANYIKKYDEIIFSQYEFEKIYEIIKNKNIKSIKKRKSYINELKAKHG